MIECLSQWTAGGDETEVENIRKGRREQFQDGERSQVRLERRQGKEVRRGEEV